MLSCWQLLHSPSTTWLDEHPAPLRATRTLAHVVIDPGCAVVVTPSHVCRFTFAAVPVGHAWHCDAAVAPGLPPNSGLLHATQVAMSTAPVLPEYVPDGHRVHITLPANKLYDPGAHDRHEATRKRPVSPLYVPAGHAWQSSPVVALKVG